MKNGDKRQHLALAQNQDQSHTGDEKQVSFIAQAQFAGNGAVIIPRAKLEAVPTHACLALPWLAWQTGHRLVGPAKQDGCSAVETGGEVEDVKEPDEDNGEGSDEP